MQLSEHFSLAELTYSETAARQGIMNQPGPTEVENLKRLAALLEQVRSLMGDKPVIINSAYRGPNVNAAVGGSKNSQHMTGCAADIRIVGCTPDQIVKAVTQSDLEYDQVIREFDRWVHISVPSQESWSPRKQALIIDSGGTRAFA